MFCDQVTAEHVVKAKMLLEQTQIKVEEEKEMIVVADEEESIDLEEQVEIQQVEVSSQEIVRLCIIVKYAMQLEAATSFK
jgi:hypothetical protein